MDQEMSDRQRAYIIHLLDERYVSGRVAGRIIMALEDQPMQGNYYGNQTDVARELKAWCNNVPPIHIALGQPKVDDV